MPTRRSSVPRWREPARSCTLRLHAYVGESVTDPRKYFRNNVSAGLSLLNSVIDAGITRFVSSESFTRSIP